MILKKIKFRKMFALIEKKINVGFGTEYVFIYILLLNIAATFIAALSFFIKQYEAERLAKNIHSLIVYDEFYYKKYCNIGQNTENIENFKSIIKEFLIYSKKTAQENGDIVFLKYLLNDENFNYFYKQNENKKNIDNDQILINKEKIIVQGQEIEAGTSIILNDNNLYYIDSDENLNCIENFDIRMYLEYFYDEKNEYNFNIYKHLNSEKLLLNYFDFDNFYEKEVYFVPELDISINEDIVSYDFYDKKNTIYDLFQNISPKILNTDKRYISEIDFTKESIENLVSNYNKKLSYKNYGYEVLFEDENSFVDLNCDIHPDEDKENLLSLFKSNRISFFFFGDIKNGKSNNYGYRIRDYRQLNYHDDMYYPFYANSLHLILNTKLYIPILNIEKNIRFSYDLIQSEN